VKGIDSMLMNFNNCGKAERQQQNISLNTTKELRTPAQENT